MAEPQPEYLPSEHEQIAHIGIGEPRDVTVPHERAYHWREPLHRLVERLALGAAAHGQLTVDCEVA